MFGFEFDLKDHHSTTAPVNYGLRKLGSYFNAFKLITWYKCSIHFRMNYTEHYLSTISIKKNSKK